MSVNHDIDFYIRTDRDRVIEIIRSTSSLSLEELLRVPDVYVRYFLLKNIDTPMVDGSKKILEQLRMFFHEFHGLDPIVETRFDKDMVELIRMRIRIVDMEDFISCISELDLSLVDLEYYRKFFGYSQIYGLYKAMIKGVFSCKYSYREIGLVMLMLDNGTLCFRRLLPIFSRLTTYVKNNLVGKNIVACCVVLKTVLMYIPHGINGKDDYVISLVSYLTGIMSQHSSFAFINESDANEIISTIEALVRYDFSVDVSRVSLGIFREIVFNLEILLQNRTTIYEEVFAVICMLEVLPSIYKLCRFGYVDYDFSSAYDTIQKSSIPKMNHISEEEWVHIHDRFLRAKYRGLDSLHTGDDSFDRIIFYNDMNEARHVSKILKGCYRLKKDILWSDVIASACSTRISVVSV